MACLLFAELLARQSLLPAIRIASTNSAFEAGLTVTDLASNKTIAKIPVKAEAGFDISNDYVVWSDLRNEKKPIGELGSYDVANADVFLYDLRTGGERRLTADPSAQIAPKIWGHYVVWMDNASDAVKDYPSDWQIVLYDLETGKQKTITSGSGGQTNPDISFGNVVWEDGRRVSDKILRAGENLPKNNTDIYMYRIDTGETIPVATEAYKEGSPQVSGNMVTWVAYDGSYRGDVFVRDTKSGKTRQLTGLEVDQSQPVINGGFVAWMDERDGISSHDIGGESHNSDIYLADLGQGTEVAVSGEGPQIRPLISDHWIVYGISADRDPIITAVRYR